jgi:hypothetical protein
MRRRTLLVLVVGLAAVVAAGVVVLWQGQEPNRITLERFDHIHDGLTRAEVESVLGPPGDYRTAPVEYNPLELLAGGSAESAGAGYTVEEDCWRGEAFVIGVGYGHGGRVRSHWEAAALNPKPGPLATLVWRAKRQWHRWFP